MVKRNTHWNHSAQHVYLECISTLAFKTSLSADDTLLFHNVVKVQVRICPWEHFGVVALCISWVLMKEDLYCWPSICLLSSSCFCSPDLLINTKPGTWSYDHRNMAIWQFPKRLNYLFRVKERCSQLGDFSISHSVELIQEHFPS